MLRRLTSIRDYYVDGGADRLACTHRNFLTNVFWKVTSSEGNDASDGELWYN